MPLFRQNYLKIYSYPTKFISSSGAFSPLLSRFLPALPILSPMGESTELQTSGARADIRSTGGHQEHRHTIPVRFIPICALIILCDLIVSGTTWGLGSRLLETLGVFVIASIFAILFGLGGGDVLVFTLITLAHGIFPAGFVFLVCCFSTAAFAFWKIATTSKESVKIDYQKECPLMPGTTVAYIIFLLTKELILWP